MTTIRWGVIGTGRIASSFVRAVRTLDDGAVLAVGSRDHQSAEAFGAAYEISRRYSSYRALVNDPDIDAVYVATPHALHAENMMMALDAGKHVLCEKPFTINAREADECIRFARIRGLFLMEAVWMRFIPAIVQVGEWIRSGLIGDVTMVRADFHGAQTFNPHSRIFDPDLGGGALLDIGVYPISFATMLLGIPDAVYSHAQFAATGVDEHTGMLLSYADGRMALLSCGFRADMVNEALIQGTRGIIRLHPPFHHPERVTLVLSGAEPEEYNIPYASTGLNYEAAEVHRCIREGLLESPVMPLDETLAVMRLMDEIRAQWGLRYPADQ